MREHPIPQDITNYRFHIVGNMTLKQFAEVGVGCIIAILIYNTPLPSLIKWPTVIFSFSLGALAAFVPIEERPIDHWIITFIKIMYKPTQYFWKRVPHIPTPFTFKPSGPSEPTKPEIDLSPARRNRIKEFMTSINVSSPSSYDLDPAEKSRVASILTIFGETSIITKQAKPRILKPKLDVRVRKLGKAGRIARTTNQMLDFALSVEQGDKTKQADIKKATATTSQVAKKIVIPDASNIGVELEATSEEERVAAHSKDDLGDRAFVEATAQDKATADPSNKAVFNTNLPFPAPPTEPNKLVGMVLTPNNELIPGAIVEIKTPDGHTARAVKSNALGQFFVTTPLKKGKYVVEVEKEGLSFVAQNLDVKDKVLEPMEVRSGPPTK